MDWSAVRLGDFISGILAICGFVGAWFALRLDVRVLKHDFNSIKTAVGLLADSMKAFSAMLTQVAVQDNRLKNVEEDLRELKHGRGFVADTQRRGDD